MHTSRPDHDVTSCVKDLRTSVEEHRFNQNFKVGMFLVHVLLPLLLVLRKCMNLSDNDGRRVSMALVIGISSSGNHVIWGHILT